MNENLYFSSDYVVDFVYNGFNITKIFYYKLKRKYVNKVKHFYGLFIQCHYCNAISDITDKDKRFKENTCHSCGAKQKGE